MGDFNITLYNPNFNKLIEDHELSPLTSETTCFKSINPTYIDNFLASKKTRFMKSLTFKTGVDHHKLVGTVLTSTLTKGKPKKIVYRCYKNLDNEKFEEKLKKHLFSVQNFELLHV